MTRPANLLKTVKLLSEQNNFIFVFLMQTEWHKYDSLPRICKFAEVTEWHNCMTIRKTDEC